MTEDVQRLIADYYHFVCRGQVSVKGKGQMLTYFLEGWRPLQNQQQHPEQHSGGFTHASVCTRLSPAPTVTTYTTIRSAPSNLSKPTSTTRYIPSVPTVMV